MQLVRSHNKHINHNISSCVYYKITNILYESEKQKWSKFFILDSSLNCLFIRVFEGLFPLKIIYSTKKVKENVFEGL